LERLPKFVRVVKQASFLHLQVPAKRTLVSSEPTRRVFRALQYHFTYTAKGTLSHAREHAQDARRFHIACKGVFTTRNAAMTFTRSRL
jgi:hypothetical protein